MLSLSNIFNKSFLIWHNHRLYSSFPKQCYIYTIIPFRLVFTSVFVRNYGRIYTSDKKILHLSCPVDCCFFEKILISPALIVSNNFSTRSLTINDEIELSKKCNKDIVTMFKSGKLNEAHSLLRRAVEISDVHVDADTYTLAMHGWVDYQKGLMSGSHLSTNYIKSIIPQPYVAIKNHITLMIGAAERVEDIFYLMEKVKLLSGKKENGVIKFLVDEEKSSLRNIFRTVPSFYNYDQVISSWVRIMKYASLSCLITSNRFLLRGIPQRATTHLVRMEQYFSDNSFCVWPTAQIYHDVMEIWYISREHRAASMAESIFSRLEAKMSSVYNSKGKNISSLLKMGAKLNEQLHRIMIRAWCCSDQNKEAAFYAMCHLNNLMKIFEDHNDCTELSSNDFVPVFECWSKAPDQDKAAKETTRLLDKMDSLLDRGLWTIQPNAECYRYTLLSLSCSNPKHFSSAGFHSERILQVMKERGLLADDICFTSAIRTWSKRASFYAQLSSPSRIKVLDAAKKADEILKCFADMYHRSNAVHVRPKTVDYNSVILAWSKSNIQDGAIRAEELLSTMEWLYVERKGDKNIKPNDESYSGAISAWANSRVTGKEKYERAIDLRLRARKGGVETVEFRNVFVALCASIDINHQVDKDLGDRVISSAIDASMVEQSDRLGPQIELRNSMTYCFLLQAVEKLLPRGNSKRQQAIFNIFIKCCADGLVDDNVINLFRDIATPNVYRRTLFLAAANDEVFVNSKILPDEWTKNVKKEKLDVSLIDKYSFRKLLPLSGKGFPVSHRNHYLCKHKVRQLRNKCKKNVLHGGRI